MVHATDEAALTAQRAPKPPPTKIWMASEPPFAGYKEAEPQVYKQTATETAIVIDNGATFLILPRLISCFVEVV